MMLLPVEKIIVKDRIRKDFGDLQELADDIKQNGLINAPVVNRDYELLAGERRLRACKILGWQQIPVNMMDTRDAEHELNIEISENDVRKGFSKSERVDYMKRLLRIEQAKAKERQNLGEKSHEGGRSDEKTAEQFGVSSNTMRKEISIAENKDLLDPSDFADWDEGKLSTNKAYQKLKEKLADRDRKIRDLESREPEREVIEKRIEVVPEEYQKAKEMYEIRDKDFRSMQSLYNEMAEKWKQSEAKVRKLEEEKNEPETKKRERLKIDAFSLCAGISNFLEQYGGYVYLMHELDDMNSLEREGIKKGLSALYSWTNEMINAKVTEVIE